MRPAISPRRFAPLAASFLGVLALAAGCGDGTGLPERYPVSGTVTYKGEPVETGAISFTPVDVANGRPASGTIEEGSYYLTTAVDGDGALPGEYKVTITSRAVDYDQAMAGVQGGMPKQDDVSKAITEAENLVPPKYSIPDTSGLTYTVTEGSNRGTDFDLTD
ncbi:hypothetical protein [Tautonia plasticadhaerens]|uniref:Carboxypeptidase regulatory-like domain-containing protein n=1 Tax=Tautonia plasticadhaerens TaxID=2527974 RepID=A0A518HC43_9BACT|nr:hypothetical protein [Tautonia plasticadhaerens]QDV38420.1 hypothetical protein ElP_63750 [Tautonia plasticadhaerens]